MGTRDFSPYLTWTDALAFRNNLTDEKVWTYNNQTCSTAALQLRLMFNTSEVVPDDMSASMVTIELPGFESPGVYSWDLNAVNIGLQQAGIYIPVFQLTNGRRYCRISCQIYNSADDYIHFGRTFQSLTL